MTEIEHTTEISKIKDTKGTVVYGEKNGVVRTIYVEKEHFKGMKELPEKITVTVSFEKD
jgi:hypothetical protein